MKLTLTLYRKEVIPVYTTSLNNKVVDGRELHSFLCIGKVYGAWIKDQIEKHNFQLNKDYVVVTPSDIIVDGVISKSGKNTKGGRTRKEYIFQLAPAKKIAMGTNNAQGDIVKDYFLECEIVAKANWGRSEITPLLDHTTRAVQVFNSRALSDKLYNEVGKDGLVKTHIEICVLLTGLKPRQYKEESKLLGVPSRYRTSARESMRFRNPEKACVASIIDELVIKGSTIDVIKPAVSTLTDTFRFLIQIGLQPSELNPSSN
jgi:phage anti-repressor protein